VTVELAEVAAGLPVAVSFALAGGITGLREGRRRSSLNEAMHELRRPLQALSLALPANRPASPAVDSSLRLAAAALTRLDREINGTPPADAHTRLSPHLLLEESVLRWRAQARLAGASLELVWGAGGVSIEGDRAELAQAVDNLIGNAIEHGGGEVTIEGRKAGAWLLITVSDSGGPPASARPRGRRPRRRGHGLRVVARTAHSHGGSFSLCRQERGMEASLRLPLPIWEERR
jgi:signal transduction histidine kinase